MMINDDRRFKRLLVCLDEKYDHVEYDTGRNIIELRVNKKDTSKNLKDILNDLSKEMKYPLLSFRSDDETYTFIYTIKEKKEKTG